MNKHTEDVLIKQQLKKVQTEIDALQSRYRFTSEAELIDALNYQLLSLQARRKFFYTLLRAKKSS